MCFGCEKVWFRDTVNIFNVCCVHKRAEVPQICYCFRQKYIPERWGWGALDFWVCWDCCENNTIFLLKCFIGAKNYPFCRYPIGCPMCAHLQLVQGQIWCNLWEEGGVPPTSKLANLTRSGIKDYECSHFEKEIAISLTLLKFPSVEHSKVRVLLSRNIHLNTPPRLSLCIFLTILKNSLGSWIQWPLFNL